MSYRRACEPATMGGPSTMTVGTDYLALGDLVEYGLPTVAAQALGDVEALFAEVIELEHQRIALAAIHAWTLAEELDE